MYYLYPHATVPEAIRGDMTDVGVCCSHPYIWSDSDRYKFIATVADEEEVEKW